MKLIMKLVIRVVEEFFDETPNDNVNRKVYWKLAYAERLLAVLGIVFLLIEKYVYNLEINFFINSSLWNDGFRYFLVNNTYKCFIFWIVFPIAEELIFKDLLIKISCRFKIKWIPMWSTFKNLLDIVFSSMFLLFVINTIIEYYSNCDVWSGKNYYYVYILGVIYGCCKFIQWVYILNSNICYEIEREYTNYYDCNGKRIEKDAYVVFYGERYKVYLSKKSWNTSYDEAKSEWRIRDLSLSTLKTKDILLEDAVRDAAGKLFVENKI